MADAAVAAPYIWGDNGAQLTPEQIASRRKVADAMSAQASDYTPIRSIWQGVARAAQGIVGGVDSGLADRAETRNADANRQMIAALLGSGGTSAPTASAATSTPVADASSPQSTAQAAAPALDDETKGYINGAATKFGVDPAYLTRTAMIESGGNANAVNPTSDAKGLYQFMPATAKEYELDNPLDPEDSANAAAELASDNRKSLTASLNRDPTNAELYLAHQQGADGAAKLLTNPNAPASSLVGMNAVIQNGGDPSMTAGQFANKWTSKFNEGQPAPVQTAAAVPVSPADTAAAIPANATPTQGYAVPGAASAVAPTPAVAKVSGALGGVNPAVLAAFTSPYASDSTKKIAGILLTQQLAPRETHTQETDKDGNVWDVNKQTGQKTIALKADADPKWSIVGKDQYGQPTYGYPMSREEYTAKQAAAASTPQSAQPDLTNVHGKDYMTVLNQQDPKYATQVQSIIEGRAPYPTGMLLKTPYGQKLAQDVTQADPSFEAGNATARVKVRNEFNAGGVGSPAGQITAGNTALQHAGEMSDALERVKADEGVLSSVGNAGIPYVSYWANQLHNSSVQGTPSGAALNDFMTAKNHFAEEVTKFYAGSAGSEAERTRALANLDAAKSLPELRSAIKTEANLMQGKVNALQDRWRTGMGPLVSDFPLIQPKSQEAIDRITQRATGNNPVASAPATAAPATVPPAAIAKLTQNPTPEMKQHFDEIFGSGAADRALGSPK